MIRKRKDPQSHNLRPEIMQRNPNVADKGKSIDKRTGHNIQNPPFEVADRQVSLWVPKRKDLEIETAPVPEGFTNKSFENGQTTLEILNNYQNPQLAVLEAEGRLIFKDSSIIVPTNSHETIGAQIREKASIASGQTSKDISEKLPSFQPIVMEEGEGGIRTEKRRGSHDDFTIGMESSKTSPIRTTVSLDESIAVQEIEPTNHINKENDGSSPNAPESLETEDEGGCGNQGTKDSWMMQEKYKSYQLISTKRLTRARSLRSCLPQNGQ